MCRKCCRTRLEVSPQLSLGDVSLRDVAMPSSRIFNEILLEIKAEYLEVMAGNAGGSDACDGPQAALIPYDGGVINTCGWYGLLSLEFCTATIHQRMHHYI